MSGDNRDKYGKIHREGDEYELGESAPGTVGDSKGSGDDQRSVSSRKQHKTVDSMESFFNESGSSRESSTTNTGSTSTTNRSKFSQGDRIEVEIDRVSNSGNPISEVDGVHVHVKSAEPGETVEAEVEEVKDSYVVAKKVVRE